MARTPDFEQANLETYLGRSVTLTPVSGGQSNPTWFVDAGETKLVLRKKPRGTTLSKAHAVEREYRVMKALEGSGVPVPKMVALEENDDVLGTAFYLMERLEGTVTEDSALPGFDKTQRRQVYDSAAQVLAILHQVNWIDVGLEGFGKPAGYFERQVAIWSKQWERSRTRDDPRIDRLAEWFSGNIPDEAPATIVHGDYRIGNLVVSAESGISGVLDWELSTIGDPRADLAHMLMFWSFNPQQLGGIFGLDYAALGIPDPDTFLDTYYKAGGASLPLLPFHRAFAFYRMAVIFEGITARSKSGQAVSDDAASVGALAAGCAALAEKILSDDTPLTLKGIKDGF